MSLCYILSDFCRFHASFPILSLILIHCWTYLLLQKMYINDYYVHFQQFFLIFINLRSFLWFCILSCILSIDNYFISKLILPISETPKSLNILLLFLLILIWGGSFFMWLWADILWKTWVPKLKTLSPEMICVLLGFGWRHCPETILVPSQFLWLIF